MNERDRESLSALMDGQADELSLQRALKQCETDAEFKELWQRYHVASDIMHKSAEISSSGFDIVGAVSQAVAAEPAYSLDDLSLDRRSQSKSIRGYVQKISIVAVIAKPIASMAIAASVTLAVVLGWQLNQSFNGSGTVPSAQVAVQAAPSGYLQQVSSKPSVVAQNVSARVESTQLAAIGEGDSLLGISAGGSITPTDVRSPIYDRLGAYMVTHAENRALYSGRGMLPYARVVSFESTEKNQ